jgi:hypothetical protein
MGGLLSSSSKKKSGLEEEGTKASSSKKPATYKRKRMMVKNLRGTTRCPHYQYLPGTELGVICSRNGCSSREKLFRCHVIKANQNFLSGTRYVVYMCNSCNQVYGEVLEASLRRISPAIDNCDCGVDWETYNVYPGQYVRDMGSNWFLFYPRDADDQPPLRRNAEVLERRL